MAQDNRISQPRYEDEEATVIIYPDIELRKGKCVNLDRGRMDSPLIYDIDPLQAAQDFAAQGAEWLHIVDLDAVFNDGDNRDLITMIIERVDCNIQVGGAIRSMDKARSWFEAGADRVVIATAAVKAPHFVKEAATVWPGQVVVSVDAREGKVVVEGWREATSFTPIAFASLFDKDELAAIIYTDIDRDDDLPLSSMSHTTELAAAIDTPVIASGVVRTLADISTLRFLPNIAGVITSRALFGGAFNLNEALTIANSPEAATAPFV